jgi:orotate phosphoribosyltransferase
MNRTELAKRIFDAAHLTGDFLLRSGQRASEYFDKYLFEAEPDLLSSIAREMKALVPENAELIAGLEMGGIPLVTALSLETGMRAAFVRKAAKEYGTCKLAEGSATAGKNVCVIEDVVTTGGQIIKSVNELRALGAKIDTVLCVILRNANAIELLQKEDLQLRYVFTMEEINAIART